MLTQLKVDYGTGEFLIDSSNKFAYTVASSISDKSVECFNPVVIYGPTGVGKTHLLYIIKAEAEAKGLNVLLTDAASFATKLIEYLSNKKSFVSLNEFRRTYYSADIVLIDNLEYLCGKETTQEELFHTLQYIYSEGHRVVLSSLSPFKSYVGMAERLLRFFDSPLICDISMPSAGLKKEFILRRLKSCELELSENSIEYLSTLENATIGYINGCLNRACLEVRANPKKRLSVVQIKKMVKEIGYEY